MALPKVPKIQPDGNIHPDVLPMIPSANLPTIPSGLLPAGGYDTTYVRLSGGSIPTATNLDTYTTQGTYTQVTAGDATLVLNYPLASIAGALTVSTAGADIVQQYVTRATLPRTFIRMRYSGVWTVWREISQDAPMPFARWKSIATQARTGAVWAQAININTLDDSAGSQPWSFSNGAITINETGMYDLTLDLSMTDGSNFALAFQMNGSALRFGQTHVGAGASFSMTTSARRRLTAGDVVLAMVYPTSNLTIATDAVASPVTFTAIKLSN